MTLNIEHPVIGVNLIPEKMKKLRKRKPIKRTKPRNLKEPKINKIKKTKSIKKIKEVIKCPKNKRIKPKGKTCIKCKFYSDKDIFCKYKKKIK